MKNIRTGMKKGFLWIGILLMAAVLFWGCGQQGGGNPQEDGGDSPDVSEMSSEETPEPVFPEDLKEGEYEIAVDSSSSMFRVVKAVLQVEDGGMKATLTMSGQGYGMLYMGTGEEALEASEDQYIPFVFNENGEKTFTVPVAALDQEVDCAAWSIRKEAWYDRTLVFRSDLLPAEAFLTGKKGGEGTVGKGSHSASPEAGEHTVEVTLTGGSGRASIASPARLTMEGETAMATLVWSSPYYEFMMVDGKQYDPIQTEGNSTFLIPIKLDEKMEVSAQTVAMSEPHLVDYTLFFDSATLK